MALATEKNTSGTLESYREEQDRKAQWTELGGEHTTHELFFFLLVIYIFVNNSAV